MATLLSDRSSERLEPALTDAAPLRHLAEHVQRHLRRRRSDLARRTRLLAAIDSALTPPAVQAKLTGMLPASARWLAADCTYAGVRLADRG